MSSDRPSTSGGPSSKNSDKNSFNFDKRVSRDDFFLASSSIPTRGVGSKPYVTTPGQLPTPDASPRSSPAPRPAIVPIIRMATPESSTENVPAGIGMALGSPAHPPRTGGTWNPQSSLRPRQASTPVLTSPASRVGGTDSYGMPIQKKQHSKWKLFSKFGRKHSDQSASAVSISEPNELKGFHRQEQPPGRWAPERSNTMENSKTLRYKPTRSQTMPYMEGHEAFGSIPIVLDDTAPSSVSAGPLLTVDIPDITMERYSVMFGSVLQPPPSQSLLARRQATVKKLKSIKDTIEHEEEKKYHVQPRRETSPQPVTRSPAFALFPPTPSSRPKQLHPLRQSQHSRSNTSPATLPSPSRATFEGSAYGQRPSIDEGSGLNSLKHPPAHHQKKGKLNIATLAKGREQNTTPVSQLGNGQSSLLRESPTDMDSPEYEVVTVEQLRPNAQHMQAEPRWQQISPSQLTLSTASSATSDRKRSPSLASSAHTHVTSSSDLDDPAVVVETAKMTAVEMSIARQISISQQQREMLRPLRTASPACPAPGKARPSPFRSTTSTSTATSPVALSIGKNERLAETKTLTPILVHPSATLDSQLAQHRKSEFIVLEGA
ncbi:Uu.00g047960.m01.CDS01 [Anthostomella pinea]|uniref:Uu.00g047960.m01.CDS01 n=1 Tax=Anthostomella pinea TaxID=933095 RepID=A0AAI8VBR1_9PEZI|nr:Uu.00g047960.m01.CDS01 [Anthostomella pinea]